MNIFQSVGLKKPKRNKFDLSNEVKLSCNMGELIPFYLQEIMPGDSFKVSTEALVRFAPLQAPIMHRVDVFTHYFFVPNRIVWDEWEDFITGGDQNDLTPVLPKLPIENSTITSFLKFRLGDYLGVPPVPDVTLAGKTLINSMPFRAYYEIFNEYYRDQNLQEKIEFDKGSGETSQADTATLTQIQYRAWEKDYFTSALPWPQRGGEAQVPLGDIQYLDTSEVYQADGSNMGAQDLSSDGFSKVVGGTTQGRIENIDKITGSINDLRKANKLQEWLETSARAGSRYIEQIKAHFNVKSSDARLQRPEYLGGGKQAVVISEVLNTVGQVDAEGEVVGAPQGDMTGHGISVGKTNGFKRSFEEHGFVLGILSVIPRTNYMQGLHRQWWKSDKYDYPWPSFANLGEQEIQNREIYQDYLSASSNAITWGYQQRYAEYKYNQSIVTGEFRYTLDFWHMARKFTEFPPLNGEFITSDPTFRIFAVTDESEHHLWIQLFNRVSALRPLPYFSIPSL